MASPPGTVPCTRSSFFRFAPQQHMVLSVTALLLLAALVGPTSSSSSASGTSPASSASLQGAGAVPIVFSAAPSPVPPFPTPVIVLLPRAPLPIKVIPGRTGSVGSS
ncbi:unnamed protein product [Urochloa humidicola]